MNTFISYVRVSSKSQGESGLGLEAQRQAIRAYVGDASILAEYTEVESGRKCDRPQLAVALAHAKQTSSILIVKKLDRLSRNVAFISRLMEAGVEFVATDMPSATRFTLHIYAAIAEEEVRMIRDRTKAALAVRKAQGMKLGAANPKIAAALEGKRKQGVENSRRSRARMFHERYLTIMPLIRALRERGETCRQVAICLNKQGYTTLKGNPFTHVQVSRVLKMSKNTVSSTGINARGDDQ